MYWSPSLPEGTSVFSTPQGQVAADVTAQNESFSLKPSKIGWDVNVVEECLHSTFYQAGNLISTTTKYSSVGVVKNSIYCLMFT